MTASTSATGVGQRREGNDNARARRDAATQDPAWLVAARRQMVREEYTFRRRNWGGTTQRRELYGMTVTVDPKTRDPLRPFVARTSADGFTTHRTAADARSAVEAEFVRREDAARDARLRAAFALSR